MDDVERDLIIETLGHTLGNRTHAATILGISIRALRNKLRDYAAQGVAVPPPRRQSRPDSPDPQRPRNPSADPPCLARAGPPRYAPGFTPLPTSAWRSAWSRCCRC
jgi:hypothetical protein